jgi:DNA-binding NarL/FixJ family response regulator
LNSEGVAVLVYLVDDHAIVRAGLKSLLSDHYKDEVQFKEASNADEVVNIDDKDDVDLIFLDLYMEGTTRLEALVKVKQHYQCNIIILSAAEDPHLIRGAIDEGAVGYIPKSSATDIYLPVLKLVIAGGIFLPPNVLDDYEERDRPDINPTSENLETLSHLTGRKLDALIKASEGKSNKVIASEMEIEIGTVKAYLGECNKLLGVHNRTAAAMALFELLGVDNRTDAIYAIASRASFDGQLKL